MCVTRTCGIAASKKCTAYGAAAVDVSTICQCFPTTCTVIAHNAAVVIDGSESTESVGSKATEHAGTGAAETGATSASSTTQTAVGCGAGPTHCAGITAT